MAEVQAQRTVAEAWLRQGSGRQRMTAEEITRVVSSLQDLMSVLASADPADKAQTYSQLGRGRPERRGQMAGLPFSGNRRSRQRRPRP
jgi:hypothetical protein